MHTFCCHPYHFVPHGWCSTVVVCSTIDICPPLERVDHANQRAVISFAKPLVFPLLRDGNAITYLPEGRATSNAQIQRERGRVRPEEPEHFRADRTSLAMRSQSPPGDPELLKGPKLETLNQLEFPT